MQTVRPMQTAKNVVKWGVVTILAVTSAPFAVTGRAAGSTITVPAGGNLQAALDRAQPGDTVLLAPGATYTGSFVLRAKSDGEPITLRSATDDSKLPGPSERIDPAAANLLATITPSDAGPALRTAPGARGWRIIAVAFVGNGRARDLITLGDGSKAQTDLQSIPSDIVLDRVLVLGDTTEGQKRGIALNSASTTIKNSYIGEIKAKAQESQAIAGWNGPGPFTIENNTLEAAGISILFGGADPAVPDLVPSDIVIRHNLMTKKLEWRGSQWTVKNILELKNARRVKIEGNRLENCWVAAQTGYAVAFTVRNSGSHAPWVTIEHVVFRDNIVSHVAGGVNILGHDTNGRESRIASDIAIVNNLFDDIDGHKWGGNGVFLMIGNGPSGVVLDHNTILQTSNLVTVYGGKKGAWTPSPGFRFTNNIARHNTYGILGDGVGFGTKAIETYFPDAVVTNNVLAGGRANRNPPHNFFPSLDELTADFVNPDNSDYRLSPRSSLRRAATDGGPLGVNFDELRRAQADPNPSLDRRGGAL
jgi:hypothetical protein